MKPVYLKSSETRLAGAERKIRFLERRGQTPEDHPDYVPGGDGGAAYAPFGLYSGISVGTTTPPRYLLWDTLVRGELGAISVGQPSRIQFDDTGIFEVYVTARVGNTAAITTKTAYLTIEERYTLDGSTWSVGGGYHGAKYVSQLGVVLPETGAIYLINRIVAVYDTDGWVNSGIAVRLYENEPGSLLAVEEFGAFIRKLSD